LSNFQVAKKRKVTILLAFFLFVLKFWRDVATRQRVWNWLKERPIGAKVIGWIQHNLLGTFRGENPDRRMENITRNVRPTSSITIPNESRRIAMANDHSETSFPIPDQLSVSSVTKRVRDNHVSIKSVLHYWFGQCAPDNSQKMLWMIAASSVQQRTKVDQEITERFQNTLIELAAPSSRLWSEWCHDPDGIYGASGKIAAMIVLDQFSRHMQRHYQNPLYENGSSSSIPAQSKLDSLALETAQLFTQIHKDEIACGMIPLPMYIFSLMPFRHQGTVESVEYVQSCIEASDSMNAQMDAMLRRFRKATNRRMAVLQDEARRTGGKTKAETKDATIFSDEDILETFPFDTDMAPAVTHPVTKTIINFLNERGIYPAKEGSVPSTPTPVIVSLSGGVDSMVIVSALANLKNACGYNLHLISVHIDYGNRPEAGAEATYVGRYSERVGFTFQCRQITEVTRGVTARDDYERIAREMRYDSYREAIASCKSVTGDDDLVVGVVLGHHRGDLRENVLSNAHKGCGPLDLSGMTAVSKNDGIAIYRPLLPLEKSFVLDYAHKFGVPYFKGEQISKLSMIYACLKTTNPHVLLQIRPQIGRHEGSYGTN
jgi:tRNA(Ile)-lysidine synthetase-like protein